jgi:hypothetical protein
MPCCFASLLAATIACHRTSSSAWAKQQETNKHHDEFYHKYLTTDAATAKQALEQQLDYIEHDTVSVRSGKAHDLFLVHSRLFVLDSRTGENDEAVINLTKAHYWLLECAELEGWPTERQAEELKRFDVNGILAMVDKQDKASGDQNGPRYLQELGAAKR